MQVRSEYPQRNLVSMAAAAVAALVAIAALLITELDTRYEAQSNGISMITTAVVEQAGAMVLPTNPTIRPR